MKNAWRMNPMKKVWFWVITGLLLLMNSLTAAVISNIGQLDSAAVFHFSIMSDNKGDAPSNSSHMQKCDAWIKNSGGIASAFVIGVGDHTVATSSTSDPILNFIKNDSYWKSKFYPGIADGENQSFGGSQGAWGKGYHLFEWVNDFYGRSNVQFRPLTSDPDDRKVDYYAKVTVSGYNVHMLNLHFSDNYNGSMGGPADPSYGFVEATQAFMQSKLEALAATKTANDIIVVLAHSTGGDFVDQGRINSTRKTLLLSTADLCVSATIHRFGWWDRYKSYNNGNSAVSYNSGSVGHSGDQNGYMDVHVLPSPTRITIQYISTVKSSRTLHTGVLGSQPDSSKKGTPIIKTINGPWGVVDWNNLPLGNTGVNNAAYVSQTVPASMVAGQTTNVTIKMKNTGTSTWSPAEAQKLGSLGDSNTWGVTRVYLPGSVAPGKTNAFTFNITAPATAGNYSFQWRMVDDEGSNIGWFGANSALQTITVSSGAMTTVPWVTNMTVAAAGTSITNAGLVVSSVSQEYHATVAAGRIFSQTPGGNTSVARGSSVALAASLGPQPQLVLNNSFETNTASWTLTGSAARSTTTHAGSGVASLRINTTTGSATQRVAIVSGKTYDISVYAYISARTAGQVVFDTGDKYDGTGQGQFVFNAANGGWNKSSGVFTATNTFLTVRMFSEGFAGTAYFDLIELKPRN